MPELVVEESGRQTYVGQGIGVATQDVTRHWQILRDAFVQHTGDANVALLAGFVRGVRRIDPDKAVPILDSVVGCPKLDVYYPNLLGAPRDDADGDRLIASMKRGLAKPRHYTLGTPHMGAGGLSIPKFCEAVDVLAQMDKGLLPAIDAVGTELSQRKSRQAEVPPEVAVLARSLLARFTFDADNHNVAWRINELAKHAFAGPEAANAAAQFAARFAIALEDYRSRSEDFGELACTLFRLQPLVALDAFLSKPNPKRHLGFRARFIARHGSIVQCAREEVLLQWVSVNPEVRAPLIAQEIDIFEKQTRESASALDDSLTEMALSLLAGRLLALAPDKAAVLQGFSRHFYPSHWSGSLAQTLAPYQALLEKLLGNAEPVVAAWAQRALDVMRQRIEHDRQMHAREEQSFE